MESMNETKEEITPGFLKAAGQYLSKYINVKGFKFGSISLAITYCVYRLYQIEWLRDMCKAVIRCCTNTLYSISVGLYNTAVFMKNASIKVFNAVTGYNSIHLRRERTERDTVTEFATMMKHEFEKLALSLKTDSTLMLKNLDQVLYQEDYDKVLDICKQFYSTAGPELEKCYANMMSYTYQVRVLVQDKNWRDMLLDTRYMKAFTDVTADKFIEYYGIDPKNPMLHIPDPDKFYRITGKSLPNNWETKYINNPDFKPYFGHISPEVGKQYMSEADYNTVKDPLGTVAQKDKQIKELENRIAELSNELRVEQISKARPLDYFQKEGDMTFKEAIDNVANLNKAHVINTTNKWEKEQQGLLNAHSYLRGPENKQLGTQQQDSTVGDIGATVALTTMAYGLYRYVRNLFNRQPETPKQQQQPVVKQTSEPPAIPIDTPPGDDSMLRPRYRRKQDEQEDDDQDEQEDEQIEQSEINHDKEKTD